MTRLPLSQLLAIQPTQGRLCNVCGSCHRTTTPSPHPASSRRKPCDLTACPPLRSSRHARIPSPSCWALGLGFEAQTKKPSSDGFVGKPPKPRVLGPTTVHRLDRPRLRLARLATMWPAPSLVVHWVPRTEPTCLSISQRPLKAEDLSRPFFTCNNTN
jgi:hypothetical protein